MDLRRLGPEDYVSGEPGWLIYVDTDYMRYLAGDARKSEPGQVFPRR